jgi:hypothetical protein
VWVAVCRVVPTLYIRSYSGRILSIFDTELVVDVQRCTLTVDGVFDFVPTPRENAFLGLNISMVRWSKSGEEIRLHV